jgi:excisionase family DNA binding protein
MELEERPVVLLIAAEEVARLMGVSERTLWRLLSAGKIPRPLHVGRSARWRLAEVREWIDRGCPVGKGDDVRRS